EGLVYRLGLVDAPDLGALDPAADPSGGHPAPVALTGAYLTHHLGLELGHDLGREGRRAEHLGLLGGGDEAALAGQQALIDPAAGALPIADFSPVLVLCDDFDRHQLALEHPVDGIARARAAADIDLVGLQRGKTGNR